MDSADSKYMHHALNLAVNGLGKVSPNPMVGAVIVKNGKILSEGWHRLYGGDHAEVDALKKLGGKAKGATMYVTLEPCSHFGKTPPCTDAILKAGIKKVVVAMTDPNPVNNGKSLKLLKNKGVQVVSGVCEEEARDLNAAFIKYMTTRMPFVVAKTAQTVDGKIAAACGDSRWVTSKETREASRERRDEFDAILVGVTTLLCDNPLLDANSKRIRKIVLDSGLRTPVNAKIFESAHPNQVIIATTKPVTSPAARRLLKRGARVIPCPAAKGLVDIRWLFRELAKEGIANILIEGGGTVIGSALKAGLVDRLHVYLAPKILGDDQARSSVRGLSVKEMAGARQLALRTVLPMGEDLFLEYEVL